jgi:ADP-dependent NAD(P)H-hydrate dehydratase
MTIHEVSAEFLRKRPLPAPVDGDKKARGNVLVVARGRDVPGAALLAGVGALRAGAGRLQIATGAGSASSLALAVPESLVLGLPETSAGGIDPTSVRRLMPLLEAADAVLIGPGMQDEDAIASLVSATLEAVGPGPAFVFDAGAIKNLYALRRILNLHRGRLLITPHAGEMAGLLGIERTDVESNPVHVASQAASDLSTVVALKGARTFIVSPEEEPSVCHEGNVGLATSGSGDVLAGVVTGLLARGAPPFVAACWGVYLHAKAGDYLSERIGSLGFLARELLPEIPRIMSKLC